MAFLTLFRIATGLSRLSRFRFYPQIQVHVKLFFLTCASGDNWNGIMKDTLREECDASEECLRFTLISAKVTFPSGTVV